MNSDDFSGYTCECSDAVLFTGQHCELEIPCASSDPCQNAGLCTNSVDYSGYECECSEMFTGRNCELEIPCGGGVSGAGNPCGNGGVCRNSDDFLSYKCTCARDYGDWLGNERLFEDF